MSCSIPCVEPAAVRNEAHKLTAGQTFTILDLVLPFCHWRNLVPISATCPKLLEAPANPGSPLYKGAFVGSPSGVPRTDGALRWIAARIRPRTVVPQRIEAIPKLGFLEVLKLSDSACSHSDSGAAAIAPVCKWLRVLHFHSSSDISSLQTLHQYKPKLTSEGLACVLSAGLPLLRKVVLHGPAVTDAALLMLEQGCQSLESLWLSCAEISSGSLANFTKQAMELRDLRFDGLDLEVKTLIAASSLQPVACLLLSDFKSEMPTLSGSVASIINKLTSIQRLGVLGNAMRWPIFASEELYVSLASRPCLQALALSHIMLENKFLDALTTGLCVLRALSLEGNHGITSDCLDRFLHSNASRKGGKLEELHLTASPWCKVDDDLLLTWVSLGIVFVSLEGASITRDGVRRSGLATLRAKACGDLSMPDAPCMMGPAGRVAQTGKGSTDSNAVYSGASATSSSGKHVQVRVLSPSQPLCYWWAKGYHYDKWSWYGVEHLDTCTCR